VPITGADDSDGVSSGAICGFDLATMHVVPPEGTGVWVILDLVGLR